VFLIHGESEIQAKLGGSLFELGVPGLGLLQDGNVTIGKV
jgi:hypothetical protein